MSKRHIDASALRSMAEDIAGLLSERSGLVSGGASVQVTDSFDRGSHRVSVAVRDAGGFPLFAVNVDLQGSLPARLVLRNALYRNQ